MEQDLKLVVRSDVIFKSELILIGFVDYFIVIAFNVVVKRR